MDFKPFEYSGVVFDSRKVTPGCLFAALPGATVDGHAFVKQAFEKGAKGILVRKDRAREFSGPESAVLIPVEDVKVSLTETARIYRRTLQAKVVGITGSAGKTTVKEFTAAFLRAKGKTAQESSRREPNLFQEPTPFRAKSHQSRIPPLPL